MAKRKPIARTLAKLIRAKDLVNMALEDIRRYDSIGRDAMVLAMASDKISEAIKQIVENK